MRIYRAVLAWALRCGAVGIMIAAVWAILEAKRAYDAARAYYDDVPAQAAGLVEPTTAPMLLAAMLGAAVLLALAEILDAVNGRKGG